jgi:hypothetical protein
MSRFVLANPSFAKRKATLLRRSLSASGHDRGLDACQGVIATIFGYSSFSELVSFKAAEASPLVERPAVEAASIQEWATIVGTRLSVDPHAALSAILATMPTSPFADAASKDDATTLPSTTANFRIAFRETAAYGALVFDDADAPGAGWASRGKKDAVRFGDIYELPNDTIWWTNIPYDVFFRKTELWRNTSLRHKNYLPVSAMDIAVEHGAEPSAYDGTFLVRLAALKFNEVMSVASELMNKAGKAPDNGRAFTRISLKAELRDLLLPVDPPENSGRLEFSDKGHDEYHVPGGRASGCGLKGISTIFLPRDRIEHARYVLSGSVPSGSFEPLSRISIQEINEGGVLEGCAMMLANLSGREGQVGLLPIPARTESERLAREIITENDREAFLEHADVSIRKGWKASSSRSVRDLFHPAVSELAETASTWAEGVVLAATWCSMTRGETSAHWAWPWVMSLDRKRMMASAMVLLDAGIPIKAYGRGWIRAGYGTVDKEAFVRALEEAGLTSPGDPRWQTRP